MREFRHPLCFNTFFQNSFSIYLKFNTIVILRGNVLLLTSLSVRLSVCLWQRSVPLTLHWFTHDERYRTYVVLSKHVIRLRSALSKYHLVLLYFKGAHVQLTTRLLVYSFIYILVEETLFQRYRESRLQGHCFLIRKIC